MIVGLARALVQLLGVALLVALAAAGLAVAVFSIQGGEQTLSPSTLAELLGLPELREAVGDWLAQLEDDGPAAVVAALAGAGAMALGLFLLLGALARSRERLLTVEESEEGALRARRRPVANALAALAARPADVLSAKARVRPRRRGRGGRARLLLTRTRNPDERESASRARGELTRLEQRLSLTVRHRFRTPRRGGRVQ